MPGPRISPVTKKSPLGTRQGGFDRIHTGRCSTDVRSCVPQPNHLVAAGAGGSVGCGGGGGGTTSELLEEADDEEDTDPPETTTSPSQHVAGWQQACLR